MQQNDILQIQNFLNYSEKNDILQNGSQQNDSQ